MNAQQEPNAVGYGVEVGGVVYRWDDEESAKAYAARNGLHVLYLLPAQEYVRYLALKEKPDDR